MVTSMFAIKNLDDLGFKYKIKINCKDVVSNSDKKIVTKLTLWLKFEDKRTLQTNKQNWYCGSCLVAINQNRH